MEELCRFLIGHMLLDFDGEVDQEAVGRFLAEDDSPLASKLRMHIANNEKFEDFLLVLSDCLREYIGSGVSPEAVQEQIEVYLEA